MPDEQVGAELISPILGHLTSDSNSNSSDSSDSSDTDSGSTSSGLGSYTSSSTSAVITSGSSNSLDSNSPSGSPVSQCTRCRHKFLGSKPGGCCPKCPTPPPPCQALTTQDDKIGTPSPKCHHQSHVHKRHKKRGHNSISHSPPLKKMHPSQTTKKKSSKLATITGGSSSTSNPLTAVPEAPTPSTSSLASTSS